MKDFKRLCIILVLVLTAMFLVACGPPVAGGTPPEEPPIVDPGVSEEERTEQIHQLFHIVYFTLGDLNLLYNQTQLPTTVPVLVPVYDYAVAISWELNGTSILSDSIAGTVDKEMFSQGRYVIRVRASLEGRNSSTWFLTLDL